MSGLAAVLTEEAMAGLIADVLAAKGLTQAEFCRRVGVSAKHMNLVLNGKAVARSQALDYWAFVLGYRFAVTLEPIGSEPVGRRAPADPAGADYCAPECLDVNGGPCDTDGGGPCISNPPETGSSLLQYDGDRRG